MWRPVNAKRTHGIGLGGMHSTGRLPSSTVPPSDLESTHRSSFESELVKKQHKLAHAREIRRAIRAKLKKERLMDTSTNFFQHNPPEKDDIAGPGPSRKRWRTESNHQHGAGQSCKRLKRDHQSCRRDSSTDEESESDESDSTSSHSENTDGSVLSSTDDELDDEEDDTLTEEDTKSDSQEEDDQVDEEDDRILAAEEEALRRMTSKASSSKLSDKRLLKKQQRSTRIKSTEDQHRGCGLVSTETPDEDPLGEGRRRRRRRRHRRRYRRHYPLKRTYRRSRRRRLRCSLTPRRRYRRRHY